MQRVFYILFNFNGRIKRRTWLVFFFALGIAEYGCELLFRNAFHIFSPAANGPGLISGDFYKSLIDYFAGVMASLLAALIFLWPSLALDVKRWHDIGRSGYCTLIVYVPVLTIYPATEAADVPEPLAPMLKSLLALTVLVYFILLAARRGNAGANRFGPAAGLPN